MTKVHIAPEDDLREHVTDGDPCPCLPRVQDGLVIHNSYDGREVGEVCRKALRDLARVMVKKRRFWPDDLRESYEDAMRLLDMHWPEKLPDAK